MLDAVAASSRPEKSRRPAASPSPRVFLRSLLALLVVASCWAIATPVDGSPDEHRHLIFGYALATGQVTATSTQYSVPDRIGLNRSACYAFSPEESAACDKAYGQSGSERITTSTSANNYPRLYYRLAGWPLRLMPNDVGVQVSRIVGAGFSCALLALAFACAGRLRTRWLSIGLLMSITPMLMFLVGSFNPHGLELAGCGAFITAMLVLLLDPDRAGRLTKGTALVAVPPMVMSRPNGFVWPLVLALLVTLAAPEARGAWQRVSARMRWALGGVIALCLGYCLWWQFARGSRDTGSGVIGPAADRFEHPSGVLLQILTKSQTFPGDWIGTFGWLDTRVTSATLLIWFGLVGGLVLIGLTLRPGKMLRVAGLSVLLAVAVTVLVDVYYRSALNVTVAQGRYVLPFAMLAMCLVALNLADVEIGRNRLPGLVAMGWVIGSVLALGESLRRYTVGVSLRSQSGYWAPPIPVAAVILVAGVAMIYLASRASREPQA